MVFEEIKHISFGEVFDLSSILTEEIYNKIQGKDYKLIGVTRGGLIPAVLISHGLGCHELFSAGVRSYEYRNKSKLEIYQMPEGNALETGEVAVLIDDIVDTGDTLSTLKKEFETRGYKVLTAALHVKKQAGFQPDLYAVGNVGHWIIYPWENQKRYTDMAEVISV